MIRPEGIPARSRIVDLIAATLEKAGRLNGQTRKPRARRSNGKAVAS